MRWWIRINKKSYGPYKVARLKEIKMLHPDTRVCAAGSDEWQDASEVPEIAEVLVERGEIAAPTPEGAPGTAEGSSRTMALKVLVGFAAAAAAVHFLKVYGITP